MWLDDQVMDARERIGYRLLELYQKHGYSRYRMSKFEEYDLYSRNRDFLLSESVITFTDSTGRLMALKPDVTLSIVKNTKDEGIGLRKLYYLEHVYRVTDPEEGYREQTQVGLECMGQVDAACIEEVLHLAEKSLKLCYRRYALVISHLGLLKSFCDDLAGDDVRLRQSLLHCVGEKNRHSLADLCREAGLQEKKVIRLLQLMDLTGVPEKVIPDLRALVAGCSEEEQMCAELAAAIPSSERDSQLLIDFSATEDLRYYTGIAFKGFLEGIPGSVLSGGQYDGLMRRMGRKDQAIGFAVFLNMLERLQEGATDA